MFKIQKEFNDTYIIDIDESNENKIDLNLFISKEINLRQLGMFLIFNKFIVHTYAKLYLKVDEIPVEYTYSIDNQNTFYSINMNFSFKNNSDNKHSQIVRDIIYKFLFGIDDELLYSEQMKSYVLKYVESINSKINEKQSKVYYKTEFLIDNLFDSSFVFKNGMNYELSEYLSSPDFRYNNLIKKYKLSQGEFYNFCFQKLFSVKTSFNDYHGFFNKIYNLINSSHKKVTYETIKINADYQNKLLEKNIFSDIYFYDKNVDNDIINTFNNDYYKSIIASFYKNLSSRFNDFRYKIYLFEDNIYFVQKNKNVYIYKEFIKYLETELENKNIFYNLKENYYNELLYLYNNKEIFEIAKYINTDFEYYSYDEMFYDIYSKIVEYEDVESYLNQFKNMH